jgi:hypothetical protein
VLNINAGNNAEILGKCKTLREYMQYIERVRGYAAQMPIQEAVERAITECIREDILADFLKRNRAEAMKVSIYEYNEEQHLATVRSEGYEDGLSDGLERGISQGIVQSILELLEDFGEVPCEIKEKIIETTISKVNGVLGIDVDRETILNILSRLNFTVETSGDDIKVTVPLFREDMESYPDIAEEIIREYGYDHIESTLLKTSAITLGGLNDEQKKIEQLKNLLVGFAFNEMINYSFVSEKEYDVFGLDKNANEHKFIKLLNPLGEDLAVMRTSLSVIRYSISAPDSTTVSCISTQFLTFAPLPTLTPRNNTLFSTSPSITQPSAAIVFLTVAPAIYLVGLSSRILV